MPKLRQYGLFVSHAWKYGDEYDRFFNMLCRVPRFDFADYSASRENPVDAQTERGIATVLKRQIEPVDVLIVLAGMYVNYHEWMQHEIDIAVGFGKPIIGVRLYRGQKLPSAVTAVANDVVPWRGKSVVKAVRTQAKRQ